VLVPPGANGRFVALGRALERPLDTVADRVQQPTNVGWVVHDTEGASDHLGHPPAGPDLATESVCFRSWHEQRRQLSKLLAGEPRLATWGGMAPQRLDALVARSPWPDLAQVAQLTRTVTSSAMGSARTDTVYLITTLTPAQASPKRLLALIRGHWQIENGLHYVRDVTFGEDRSRLRSGNAPQILAACRNFAITLIHRSGSCDIAASRRAFAYHPRRALNLLL
jgi:predicted transposase YbfD/YdcC